MAATIQGSDVEKTSTSLNNPSSAPGNSTQPSPTPKPESPSAPSIGSFNQANSQTPTPPKPRQQGTGFTNLNRVINANQNNRLGSTVSGGINQNVNNVRTGVQNAQNEFQTQSQQGALGNAEQEQARQGFLNRAQSGDVTDQDIQNAQRFISGQYTGPQGLANSDALNAQAQSAQELAQQAGTTGGRASLLQRFAGGNQYTQGQQNLDNLLLGATGGNELNQARRAGTGLLQNVQNTAQGAEAQANALAQQSQAFGQQTGNLLNAQQQGVNSAINQNLTAAQQAEKNRQDLYSNLQNTLGGVANQQGGATEIKASLNKAVAGGLIDQATADQLSQKSQYLQNLKGIDVGANANQLGQSYQRLKAVATTGDLGMLSPGEQSAVHGIANARGISINDAAGIYANQQQQKTDYFNKISDAQKAGQLSNSNLATELLSGLKGTEAQNLTAEGLADNQQRAQLNALSKLTGQNVAFGENAPTFQAGSTSFDPQKAQQDAILNSLFARAGNDKYLGGV